MLLTEPLTDSFDYKGERYQVDMAFDNILLFYDMLNDPDLNDVERVHIGLVMLLGDDAEELSFELQYRLFKHVMKEFLHVDMEQKEEEGTPQKKVMDFKQDAELIYASFLYDYNIDLFEEQGRLHWDKFRAMLSGLSEDSALMKVVHIRTMEVPKPNKHNAKERKQIQDAKRRHALEQSEESIQSNLNQAANFLRGKAGEK